MDETSAWDSPWALVLILALICLSVGLWLNARGDGWSPDAARQLLERALSDSEVRRERQELRAGHAEAVNTLKAAHQKKVDELRADIARQKRENDRIRAELERRSGAR